MKFPLKACLPCSYWISEAYADIDIWEIKNKSLSFRSLQSVGFIIRL